MNVVDSSGWLAYFASESTAPFFAEAIEDTGKLLVPTVCLYEVYKVTLRESGEEAAIEAMVQMQGGEVVDLTAEIALEAAIVAKAEKLAMADAIIYTVAKKHSATLWAQDEHFAGKPNVQFRAKPRVG